MDKPKKETLLNQNTDSKLCLNCGFPNRTSDAHCMYCHTSLLDDQGLISWLRQTYYILRWRWQLKRRQREKVAKPKQQGMTVFKAVGYFLVGAALSGVGIFVFTDAVGSHSFTRGIIAILFLLYGFFTLKALFAKK